MLKKLSKLVIAVSLGATIGALAGCSSSQQANLGSNLLATLCTNGQSLMVNIPTGLLTPAQVAGLQATACSTAFGSTAAPASAPGQYPIFAPVPPPTPAPVPSPAAPAVKIPASLGHATAN